MGARPSSFTAPVVEAKSAREWSTAQEDIFQWFADLPAQDPAYDIGGMNPGLPTRRDERQNLVVRARAGTGKTTTIIEGVNRAPEPSILVCAFNTKIAKELSSRLENPNAEARTLHSLGLQLIRREWRGMPVNSKKDHKVYRADDLTDRALKLTEQQTKAKTPFPIRRKITGLHTKAREMCPLDQTEQALTTLAYRFDLVPDEGWGHYDLEFVVTHALLALHEAATVEPRWDIGVDYADMMFLPLAWNLTSKDYQLVVVDEAQDMNMAQLELAERVCGGRLCIVGDDRQCQPAGTMVRSSIDGNVPIESLQVGDTIESFDRHGQVFIKSGRVNQIASRHYQGPLVNVAAGSHVTRCTPNHKWLVRWTDKKAETTWVTYLMRKGSQFRVGQCQLFRKGCNNFGLSERGRVERADSAWVLQVHDSLESALAYEQILAARYGLPEMVFHPPSRIKYFTQHVIDQVYSALDSAEQYDKAVRCLTDHGRRIEYPLYTKANDYERRGRTTLFETQACNLLSGFMSVAMAPDVIPGHDKKDRHAVKWAPVAVWEEDFDGLVYSLDIDRYHKYIADGLVTCNSIYSFRGADSGALDRLKNRLQALELPLTTTYRCGQRIVRLAQDLVPDIQAGPNNPEGVVDYCTPDDLVRLVTPGDFVLSRLNAPLVSLTLKLLRHGIRATMAGRDVGEGVMKILEKLKVASTTRLETVQKLVEGWESKQVTKLAARGLNEEIDRIRDQADVLYAFIMDADSTSQMWQRMNTLFSTEGEVPPASVLCSSVHKAKGLEANRVFVLKSTFYRRGQTPEEDNCFYVAVTRAKQHLTLVEEKK